MSRQITVLLVEDFRPWREAIREILQQRSDLKIVGEAKDGHEAVLKASELKPDLILLDIGLPLMDGIQAASRIQEFLPAIRIIFVTLYADTEVVRAAMSDGALGCLSKVDIDRELLRCIDSVCRGERYISGGVSASDVVH